LRRTEERRPDLLNDWPTNEWSTQQSMFSDTDGRKVAINGIAGTRFSVVDLTFWTETHRRLWASFRDERILTWTPHHWSSEKRLTISKTSNLVTLSRLTSALWKGTDTVFRLSRALLFLASTELNGALSRVTRSWFAEFRTAWA
jgi:hypothetical protein